MSFPSYPLRALVVGHSIATSNIYYSLADDSKQSSYDSLLPLVSPQIGIAHIEENYRLDSDSGSCVPNRKNEGRHCVYI